jgi:hypothetical protein
MISYIAMARHDNRMAPRLREGSALRQTEFEGGHKWCISLN